MFLTNYYSGYNGGGNKYSHDSSSSSIYQDTTSRRSTLNNNYNNNNYILPTYSNNNNDNVDNAPVLGQIYTDVRMEQEKKNLLTLPTDPNKMYIKQGSNTDKSFLSTSVNKGRRGTWGSNPYPQQKIFFFVSKEKNMCFVFCQIIGSLYCTKKVSLRIVR